MMWKRSQNDVIFTVLKQRVEFKCKSFNAVSAKNESNGVDGGGGGGDIDKTSNWEKKDIKLSLYSKILIMFVILLIIYE